MSDRLKITTPLTDYVVKSLKSGDKVLLSGYIYTGRDAAHKKMIDAVNAGEELPFDVDGQVIFYVGPSPSRPGRVIGSAGPTTSYRMDDLTLPLLERGLKGMIGKGQRSDQVIEGMKKNNSVYFAAIGGAGALISDCIKEVEIIAYEELGTEAVRKLRVEEMPLIVVIDSQGNNMYMTERIKYSRED